MVDSSSSTQEQSDAKRNKGSAHATLHPLDNNNQLRHVFEMLGCGHWLFAGAVSQRWRDLYREVCAAANKTKRKWKLVEQPDGGFGRHSLAAQLTPTVTYYKSLLASASRLHLACALDLQLKTHPALPKAVGRFANKRTLL
jgi:hypothetical protein